MRRLLAATCLTPVALLAVPAAATTVVSTASTTPINTSTANNGSPDDVQISTGGSLKPTTSPAITVDSNNNVDNEGIIQITDVPNSVGILIQPGRTTNIINGGTIQIDESFTSTDTNGDGIIDPPFAQGSGRFGIHALGAMTGTIVNTGTITIKGNNSAAIALDGPLTGSLSSNGVITVTGDNSFGIHTADVSGGVTVGSTVGVTGQNSIGVALDGHVGGETVFQGIVTATGFSSTAAGVTNNADLEPNGAGVRIQGSIDGGLLFAALPTATSTTNTDVNNDGIADSGEGTASISVSGPNAAVQIGGTSGGMTIGALAAGAAGGAGILNEGVIAGSGIDAGIAANAMQIGGLGGTVTVTGGLVNTGSITADSIDSNATGLHIGTGASLGTIVNNGTIGATSGSTAAGTVVQAIAIDAGAGVNSISNSGTISGRITGSTGTGIAIADRSGGLASITNTGTIIGGAPSGTAIAIDLRANTTGATVRQLAPSGSTTPAISGAILFGGGSNVLDLEAGTFTGNASFGGGNAAMTLAGSAVETGDVDFGGATGTLTLGDTAQLHGALANSGAVAVAVNGGTLDLTNGGTVPLASLSVGGTGSFTVNVDGGAGTHTLYDIAGNASFAPGAKVNLKLTSISGNEGDFLILHAGSLSGADQLTSVGGIVPFLFQTNLAIDQANGDISLQIQRKTAAQLGLNRSQSAIFDAAVQALDSDAAVAGVFLDAQDAATLQNGFRQLLPDHAGAVFQSVSQGSRAEIRALADPLTPLVDLGGGWGLLAQQVAWGENKQIGDTDSYRTIGWGAEAGPEFSLGPIGSVGLAISYLTGSEKDGAAGDEVVNNEYELAGYWRAQWKGLRVFARGSIGRLTFDSSRFFTGSDGTTTVSRTAKGHWSGTAITASGGLSYELHSGAFSLRPGVSLDYVRLKENAYSEAGGGAAFDLAVDARSSREEAVNATLTLGYDLVRPHGADHSYFRIELEGGRRDLIDSAIGTTTARFAGGSDFTLLPDVQDSGWLGRLRLLGGSANFQIGGEASAERQQGREAIAVRAGVQLRF